MLNVNREVLLLYSNKVEAHYLSDSAFSIFIAWKA